LWTKRILRERFPINVKNGNTKKLKEYINTDFLTYMKILIRVAKSRTGLYRGGELNLGNHGQPPPPNSILLT
jgi:hypothetical protein